jgi:hypothetical protein
LLEGAEENRENLRIAGIPLEIWTGRLPYTIQKCHHWRKVSKWKKSEYDPR